MSPRWQTAVAALLSGVLVAVLSGTFLARTDFFNPFDENSHYDYVVRIASTGAVPARDAQLTQQALADWACSGVPGFERLECGAAEQRPVDAPWEGANTATRYFPSYYALTAAPTRVLHDVSALSWLDAARAATTLWLVGLAVGLVLLARALGISTQAALAASLLACSMPLVVVQGVSLNNDVAAATVGVLAVWSWLRLRSSPPLRRLIVSGALALLAMTMKETALVAALCIGLLEWGHTRSAAEGAAALRRGSARAAAVVAGVVGGYLLLVYVLDPVVRGATSTTAEALVSQAVAAAEPQAWAAATAKAYGYLPYSLQSAGFIPVFDGPWAQVLPVLVAMVVVGSVAARSIRGSWPWAVPPGTAVTYGVGAFLVAFPVMALATMSVSGLPLVFQPRYYLAGMALAFVPTFHGLGRRWSYAALAAAVSVYAFMLAAVLGA
ncbi:MAG: glycosyltransferase family 39 protein [Candidatus Nanopelagicales bacterium]